jgi:XTP/dITP diphosphohydrolase
VLNVIVTFNLKILTFNLKSMKPSKHFEDLVEIIKILRKECPWDRKQTHQSIKDNLIEEAYEAVHAIDQQDDNELKKELGDLLLHVIFHSRMATETNSFTINDVIYAIQEKLIRRHPHVFGKNKVEVKNEKEVAKNWESIKMNEGRESVLEGLPPHLPALIRAQRMQEKAGNAGFDWKKSETGKQQLWDKLQEELDEFKIAYHNENSQRAAEEFGDFLFSIVNAARFLNVQAENALRMSNKKFKARFQYIEEQVSQSDREISDVSIDEMEEYWQQAKGKV